MDVELEIKLAKEREDEYGKACLDSAYKAYKSLMEDGHSGMSFSITRSILENLLYDIPLSPITEKDFEDATPERYEGAAYEIRQCPRRTSLFQETHDDGHVEYDDVNRVVFIDELGFSWTCGVASRTINALHPISLPYKPRKERYRVYGYSFMHNRETCDVWYERGSYTFAYLEYYKTPDGERHELDMLFEENADGMVETTDGARKAKIKENAKKAIEESKKAHEECMRNFREDEE